MKSIYLQEFKSREEVEKSYEVTLTDDINILLAWYGYGDYSGDSFVLFEKDGKLFEVNGGHCSCNGLEGQWEPEETSVEALESILTNGTKFSGDYEGADEATTQLKAVLEALKTGENKKIILESDPAKRNGAEIKKLLSK